MEDLTQKEIAKILITKEGTIRTRLSRALKQLRSILEEEDSYVLSETQL